MDGDGRRQSVVRRFRLGEVALAVAVGGDGPPALVIGLPGGERIEIVAGRPADCVRLRVLGELLVSAAGGS